MEYERWQSVINRQCQYVRLLAALPSKYWPNITYMVTIFEERVRKFTREPSSLPGKRDITAIIFTAPAKAS